MADLRKLIKWVLLIQIQFRRLLWVIWAKGKAWEKNSFWFFWFDRLWPFNFQFDYRPKSSNHVILVSAHPISKLKIDPESSWSREFMVRKKFWYLECLKSINPYDSSPPLRDKIRVVTQEKFLKHGFSFFHLILPFSFESRLKWHFGCLI